MSSGSRAGKKGTIATSYFINAIAPTYPRNLVVNDSLFENVEVYEFTFRAVAKSSFKAKYTVSDYSATRSVIINESTNASVILTEGTVYTFEKGISYLFGYGFSQVGNGVSFATGKVI